jgi:hypothetical protein
LEKKILRNLNLLVLLLSAQLLYAEVGEEWIKKYAIAGGIDFAITKGDLDGISKIRSSDKSLKEESVILPEVPSFLIYAFDLRALANEHSIAFNFGLGYPDYEHSEQSGEARYLRLGMEYQYHFLWPNPFRLGLGLGYAFSSMRFPKASIGAEAKEWSYANFTGNGANAVLSAEYYFTENLAIEGAIRYRLLYLNRVATDLNDVSKLNDAVWQGMGELGLRWMFVF